MVKYDKQTEVRILYALPRIEALQHRERLPVEVAAWHVGGEPVSYEQALQANYIPFSLGEAWGPAWDTTWFRVRGRIPTDWAGRECVLLFQLTGQGREGFTAEGLVYAKGKPIRAINRARNDIELDSILDAEGNFEIYIEGAANIANPAGELVEYKEGPLFILAQAELSWLNRPAFDFYYDFKTASEAMETLPEKSQRRAELRCALNESLNCLVEGKESTLGEARQALQEVLTRKNGDTVHRLSAIGNAHIDTAWLWPLRETIRKCARTFSTALDYMEKYPDYIFSCSQPQQYAWMKAHYPDIYEKIKKFVQRGQWEPIGSMWIEVDCNLASGESLIRQILHGKKFFQEEFGYETKDAWLPDVFGYSAAMPQIFKGCGIDYFVTQKISWNQFNKFPHHTFLWEGIDGTRIFTHFPPADTYNAQVVPKELLYNVENFREHGRATRSIYLYGNGDGGGGPTIQMLEQARRLKNFEGLPCLELERVADFLPKAAKDIKDPAIWSGELYLELHRGTYTTQAQVKKSNRECEFLLRNAEFFDALSHVLVPDRQEGAANPPRAIYDVTGLGLKDSHRNVRALERAWKLLLLNQFHDIIPGSSIGWVYQNAHQDYQVIRELGESVRDGSIKTLATCIDTGATTEPLYVGNTLNWERIEIVELPDGRLRRVIAPPCGYTIVDAAQATPEDSCVIVRELDGEISLSNEWLRVKIGQNGLLKSVFDLEAAREVLAPGQDGNVFQLHPDLPNSFDAWDIDIFYRERCTDLRTLVRMEVVEALPLRAKIRIERNFGDSRIIQDVVLKAGSRRLDFETEVDWHENHQLLKVAFPVDVKSSRATYEIQFGHTERPTHANTSWDVARFEVCAHKWADLSEADYGVALLNDCKYGYDIHENVMRLTLLRSPGAPDPTADRGTHRFIYSLLPHQGDLRQGHVIEEAYQLNVPLLIKPLKPGKGNLPTEASYFRTDAPGMIIEAVKLAEDGAGLVLRLYEAFGTRRNARLHVNLPLSFVQRTDMLERPQGERELIPHDGAVELYVRPFEIVTLKFTPERHR